MIFPRGVLSYGVGIFVLALLAVPTQDGAAATVPSLHTGKVLIDGVHANDLTTVGLGPDVYEYHQTTGFRRLFEYMRARGVPCDRMLDGRLDAKRLAGYRLLFINLVSSERSPLLVSEIQAIRSFVREGGSLLAITDHSNAYWHAFKLEPLFTELDIKSFTDTTCEEPPNVLSSNPAWIAVTRFKPHPITADLHRLGLAAGGCVDPRYAVANTSEHSWADAWSTGFFGERNAPGLVGNLRRDPGERAGPLGVVMAKEFGRGRIVVVADQNMFGENFVHYADNYRLWFNSLAWLLDEPRLCDTKPYEQWRSPRIVCYEPRDRATFGSPDVCGCYHIWSLLNRFYWTFAADRIAPPCELVVFAFNESQLPADVVAETIAHLRRGGNVLVLNADSATLWKPPGVVGQILKSMGIADPKRETREGKIIIRLPGAGSIHVLGPDALVDNGILPPPTQPPREAEKRRNQQLLDAVGDALKNRQ